MMQWCSNLTQKPTRTTQIRKHYYKLTVVIWAKVSRFEHWVMYLLKYWFRITFNPKKCTCSFKKFEIIWKWIKKYIINKHTYTLDDKIFFTNE